MNRTLLLLGSCTALFALATPIPAKAAVWCGGYWSSSGRCHVAYTVVRPVAVAVRPVVAVTPIYTVAYRRIVVPYSYTAVAYRPAVVPYTRLCLHADRFCHRDLRVCAGHEAPVDLRLEHDPEKIMLKQSVLFL